MSRLDWSAIMTQAAEVLPDTPGRVSESANLPHSHEFSWI